MIYSITYKATILVAIAVKKILLALYLANVLINAIMNINFLITISIYCIKFIIELSYQYLR